MIIIPDFQKPNQLAVSGLLIFKLPRLQDIREQDKKKHLIVYYF
jgi:hypothetical protein